MSMYDEIEASLIRLIKTWPLANNQCGFVLEHDGKSGFRLPGFYAQNDLFPTRFHGYRPRDAVNSLLRNAGITRVEEYVRAKSYSTKAGAA